MSPATFHQQIHGYDKGHQLLSSSLALEAPDQHVVNRLSDLTGRIRPGELFDPYLTAYPLPSQAYYVVARTFQDLEAPRSGCVLTRSLFVPMDAWAALNHLEWLMPMLAPVQRGEQVSPSQHSTTGGIPPKKVSDGRVVELVDALFFDIMRPVVVFDAAEADLIATRLLVALWPSLRCHFSFCTLAFGPRRLGDHDFDLHFAPLSVQSRFSSEGFRRIGVRGSVPGETVHHLAASTATRIFHSDEPRLAAPDILDFLGESEVGDRSAVRIVLRWDELASRAKTTPTAVLGMLDILNSRGGPGPQGWERLFPKVSAALRLATESPTSPDAWEFLLGLTAKVEWSGAPAGLEPTIETAVRSLAQYEPEEALRVMGELTVGVPAPAAIVKGVGDGVAESSAFEALSDCFNRLAPDLLLRLVAESDALAEALVTVMNTTPTPWLSILMQVLEGEDVGSRRRVRRRFLSLVDDSVAAKAVPSLLSDIADPELTDLALELARRGKLRSQPFNAAFAQAVRDSASVYVVRDAVTTAAPSQDIYAFLLELVEFGQADLDWLLALDQVPLAGRLLTALLADADPKAIHSLLSKRGRATRIVSALRAALPTSASQIARILILDLMPTGVGLDVGFDVVPMLSRERRPSFEAWLLRAVLSRAPLGDSRVGHALAEFRTGLSPVELVAAATDSSIGVRRLSRNIEALNAAPKAVRDGVVGVVDALTRHLVERRWERLSEAAYRGWGALLTDAASSDPERSLEASAIALRFALRRISYPVSSLVVASFPTVYGELPKLKKLEQNGDSFLVSFHFSASRKKLKDAQRELIDTLVDAFLHSTWPPADLIIAALEADAGSRVVKRLRRRFSGSRYLQSIRKDGRRLDDESRHRVLACLSDRE